MNKLYLLLIFSFILKISAQGPYAPDAETSGTTAIHYEDGQFISWASGCEVTRGLQDIADPSLGYASVGTNADAVGKPTTNGVVSLGDGGYAILTFEKPIFNGAGFDFAVFENSFNHTFLELAFVEVSSDGVNYVRFPSVSLTQTTTQIDGFGDVDPTNINNLAGKYKALYGTPFDLEELKDEPNLDVNNITHIKIMDVVGSINPTYARYDSQGNIINDPYNTPFASGGFDLDAVGVIHTTLSLQKNELTSTQIFPNPAKEFLTIQLDVLGEKLISLTDINGKEVKNTSTKNIHYLLSVSDLERGIYFMKIYTDKAVLMRKIVLE
ncbi:MAG: T9SS type A sorting domain-containing protein [Bacteroidia bacterium]